MESWAAMASSAPSQYLLRWNDHLSNYGDILFSLREQEEYVDCSIACEDGLVGAHRVVLAGCSPYLRDLFSRVANPHPVIFLLNTSRSLVLMLMEFIYRGQVHIPQHRLQQLVILGQALKIKGLTQIMVPVSTASSTSSEPSSSITPLAFPHGLPLTSTNVLPFTAIPNSTSSMDISVLSSANGEQNEEEEKIEESRIDGEEEENENEEAEEGRRGRKKDMKQRRRRRIEQPRGRPPRQCAPQTSHSKKRFTSSDKAAMSPSKPQSPLKSYVYPVKDKVDIGAYAVSYGIDATKSYVLTKYKIRVRQKTLERLVMWYKEYQKVKEKRTKRKKQEAVDN